MADNNSGSNNMLVFILGGLVVAVAVIGWVLYNGGMYPRGGMQGGTHMDVTIQAPSAGTTEAPAKSAAPAN